MTYKGAVFFDYDGTITDEQAGIFLPTAKTLTAFERLKKNGYLVILATGRAIPYARHVLQCFDGIVTSNGTFSTVGEKVVADHPIEPSLLQALIAAMDASNVVYGIDNPAICYAKDMDDPRFRAWLRNFRIPEAAFAPLPDNALPSGYKLSAVFDTAAQMHEFRQRFASLFSFDRQRQALSADITRCGFHKGVGVRDIVTYFRIPEAETYAFVDGENDVGMLQAVRHGVAMGQHNEKLLPYADFVTKSVMEEGIYTGLRQLGLI